VVKDFITARYTTLYTAPLDYLYVLTITTHVGTPAYPVPGYGYPGTDTRYPDTCYSCKQVSSGY